jgi:hypothetical protein
LAMATPPLSEASGVTIVPPLTTKSAFMLISSSCFVGAQSAR